MASEIRSKDAAKAAFTCTLASLANASARQSSMLTNSTDQPAAIVYLTIQLNGDPTADGSIGVYLLRGNDAPADSDYRTDGAGVSDSAITIVNAHQLGSIFVPSSAATGSYVYGEFDTNGVPGPLGPSWGIAVDNRSGVALGSTEGNHYKGYVYYVPESQ